MEQHTFWHRPLILLVGERSTKQVLRNVRGLATAFSLAAAPLGLLSVVTSLIRFCGIQHLRAFIGYELEARTVVGMEVTRVNCGGVSAHLTDGYVVRSMTANPASQLVAVSYVEGQDRDVRMQALSRIRAGEAFARAKEKLKIPSGVAGSDWVLHIVTKCSDYEVLEATLQTLASAVGLNGSSEELRKFQALFFKKRGGAEKRTDDMERITKSPTEIERSDTSTKISTRKKSAQTSAIEKIATLSTTDEKDAEPEPFWDFTFMSTFDAVSEFTTSQQASRISAITIGMLAFLAILGIHILALWQNGWVLSIGWILVIVGYFGVVFGVMLAALLMNSSSVCIPLDDKSRSRHASSAAWKDGMVVSVKNTDSMDTTGSAFVASSGMHQTLEAVWIKSISQNDRLIASGVTLTLVIAFVAHYLGLRAIIWWTSVGELGICILAAFARSASNNLQPQFAVVEGVKIDKRCMSTGIIRTQASHIVEEPGQGLDARAYSLKNLDYAPTVAERVAYQTAKMCMEDTKMRNLVSKLTGMTVQIMTEGQVPQHRAVLITFTGGVLFKEGIGFPATQCMLAFRASTSSLAAPSGLLARAIMRQPAWTLERGVAVNIPLGNVYIFAMQSMLDWWTLSEDRNDMGDLQRNLHWPLFLVNLAFFLEVMRLGQEDEELLDIVGGKHDPGQEGDLKVAGEVTTYLKNWKWD